MWDWLIVGGGACGLALGYGASRRGQRVLVLDDKDALARPSRGNFGLIWVQGKGADFTDYARITQASARLWPGFAQELQQLTGVDLEYRPSGGLDFCLSARELAERAAELAALHAATGLQTQMLTRAEVARRLPGVGEVTGASWCDADAHVNPLMLLLALAQGIERQGGRVRRGSAVQTAEAGSDGIRLQLADGTQVQGRRLLLCTGLGGEPLRNELGASLPVRGVKGQILVTARQPPLLPFATAHLRQTADGTVLCGDSWEEGDTGNQTRVSVLSAIARTATQLLPALGRARMLRAWAATRVITPDGAPLYQPSTLYANVHSVACHSGITLAAWHALELAELLEQQSGAPLISMTTERFDVETNPSRRHRIGSH
ncbi:FAD-dependent oxidoreductase [Oceanimonas pelagia]|uniref:FAD-dependent oxidoreductase n=1 Tax=Oceanimonas pelagia TaxID=3028314 RepID=A0AA50QDJ1_9GAMM|nr:FAD-dependent oxidoreductase [Oceanimonas pelagia]WMC12352.1 FAD-dependent oxidoreductase [Oceanimonas pelagia]